jgi:TIR domain
MKADALNSGANDTVLGNAQHCRALELLEVAQIVQELVGREKLLQKGQSRREGSSPNPVEIKLQIILEALNIVMGRVQSGSKLETPLVRKKRLRRAKIFISYRRNDSSGHAGRVQDRLQHEFGSDLVFMDVDAIPLGVNFVKALRKGVARCSVLLAVIGPGWLDVRDDHGNRRLDNPNDFVRIEIAAALQRNIPVIPILLDGATIPRADQLPKEIEELAQRNALYVRHASFHRDLDKLVRGLKVTIYGVRQDHDGHSATTNRMLA